MDIYQDLFKKMSERRTTKIYDPGKEIDEQKLHKLFAFANTAPTSMGLELYKVLNFRKSNKIFKELFTYLDPYNVKDRAENASDIALIITKKESYIKTNRKEFRENGSRILKAAANEFKQPFDPQLLDQFEKTADDFSFGDKNGSRIEWLSKQGFIVLSYLIIGATVLGIDTTAVGGFDDKINHFLINKKLMKDDEKVSVILFMGYIKENTIGATIGPKQIRFPVETKFKIIR